MSKAATKTDNSELQGKVALRLESLAHINRQTIRVLERYGGNGVIWSEVRKHPERPISILKIEKESGKGGVYLKGDNIKFLGSLDLSDFDLIDLDAYGIPFEQLRILFDRGYRGIVHVTAIQSQMGMLPQRLLYENGFTKPMIKKTPTLFSRRGDQILFNYLAKRGVCSIRLFQKYRKKYFWFFLE